MHASDTRLGRGRANQFGSCPTLPTKTKATPCSLAQALSPHRIPMILDSSWSAGSGILVMFVRRRLGMKGSCPHNGRPSTGRLNDKPTISFHDLCTAYCALRDGFGGLDLSIEIVPVRLFC